MYIAKIGSTVASSSEYCILNTSVMNATRVCAGDPPARSMGCAGNLPSLILGCRQSAINRGDVSVLCGSRLDLVWILRGTSRRLRQIRALWLPQGCHATQWGGIQLARYRIGQASNWLDTESGRYLARVGRCQARTRRRRSLPCMAVRIHSGIRWSA